MNRTCQADEEWWQVGRGNGMCKGTEVASNVWNLRRHFVWLKHAVLISY